MDKITFKSYLQKKTYRIYYNTLDVYELLILHDNLLNLFIHNSIMTK